MLRDAEDDNNLCYKLIKKNEELRKQTIKFRFPHSTKESELKPLFHSLSVSIAATAFPTAKQWMYVHSRFHLIEIQIAVPFIKRTIKSSFAISDTTMKIFSSPRKALVLVIFQSGRRVEIIFRPPALTKPKRLTGGRAVKIMFCTRDISECRLENDYR